MNNDNTQIKIAPNSKDSEMMVLGCMLTSINSLNIGADGLNDSDFYFTEHKIIFGIVKQFYKQDKPVDVHLLAEELKRQEKLETIGGISYITTLVQYAGTSAYIEQYVELVRSKSILRRMIHAAQTIEKNALSDPENVYECLDEAQQFFFKISQTTSSNTGSLLADLLTGVKSSSGKSYINALQERQEELTNRDPNDPGITGIPTHFTDMDKMLNGFNKSNFNILAARPAMGKTAFALNIAANICFKGRMPIGVFSLEMSADQLVDRLIASHSQVEAGKIQVGSLSGDEFQAVCSAVEDMQQHTMVIDDQPGLRISDLRARARRMKENHDIQFLVIDYLQLITGSASGRGPENRQSEISEISRLLKNLARELDVPILCLSQLSRKVEERQGHRPQMSDLRESGSIEQDADVVMFLLRRDYYDENDRPGHVELIIGKNRHGETGNVHLSFHKSVVKFDNAKPYEFENQADSPADMAGSPAVF